MSEFSTAEIHTNERLLRSDVTLEECKKIEKVLRKNNISYFEKWKFHTGLFHVISSRKNSKCDIYYTFIQIPSKGQSRHWESRQQSSL